MNLVHENKENKFILAQLEQVELDYAAGKTQEYVTLGMTTITTS